MLFVKKMTETFIYEGLGFPIQLIDTPMKKVFGEWMIDIDMNALQKFVFKGLIHKPQSLTGKEMKFMRKFLELSTTKLGERLGVTHAAVLKWEKETAKISKAQECYLRLILMEYFRESELIKLYKEITPEKLTEFSKEKQSVLSIDIKSLKEAS